MALKFEYPYIKFLTLKDKKNYQSDLPENIDDLEVFHIRPSQLYGGAPFDFFKSNCYWTPEQRNSINKFDNNRLWMCILIAAIGWSAVRHTNMYWVNPVRNYIEFSSETWPKYFKRRFHLIGICGFLLNHFYVFKGNFANYPKVIG